MNCRTLAISAGDSDLSFLMRRFCSRVMGFLRRQAMHARYGGGMLVSDWEPRLGKRLRNIL
jgi:hypothetical protein